VSEQWYCPIHGPIADTWVSRISMERHCKKCDTPVADDMPPFVTAMQEEIEALKSAPLFNALANKQEARIAALEKVAEAAAKIWNPQSWLPVINFDELGEALREAGYLKEEG